METVRVPFSPGNGKTYLIDVAYIHYSGVVGADCMSCAFCDGDPCNEAPATQGTHAQIGQYYEDSHANGSKPETCPLCKGMPS